MEEVVHIPLIVKFPKSMRPPALGNEVAELTSSVDLLPALAGLLGRAAPKQAHGSPIFGGTFGDLILIDGYACPSALNDCLGSWAVLKDRYKLIGSPGEALLFDLEHDRLNKNSIAESGRNWSLSCAPPRPNSAADRLGIPRPRREIEIDDEAVRHGTSNSAPAINTTDTSSTGLTAAQAGLLQCRLSIALPSPQPAALELLELPH